MATATSIIDKVLVPGYGSLEEIRRFSDLNLQATIDRALTNVPEGKRINVTSYIDLATRQVETGVWYKINDDWSFVGNLKVAPFDENKLVSGGALIRWVK